MILKGAEILVKCLEEQGVGFVFGYPGASVLSVYDALSSSSVRHILTAHEQGACFAAEGYARASGTAGVTLATSGPGATNLVTGIADAYMDSVPLIAITGNVPLDKLGHDSFQEVDIFGMTMPVTKYGMIVKKAQDLAPAVRRAFGIAQSGRKGPVLIDVPSNVFDEYAEYEKLPPIKANKNSLQICEADIDSAVKFINKCERPVIYAGGGVRASGAEAELAAFAQIIGAPVTVSYMGIGCFDPDSPYFLGVLSDANLKASRAIKECDGVITVGARFNSRYSAAKIIAKRKLPLLQIDIDRAEIDKNVYSSASVIGDIKDILQKLTPLLAEKDSAIDKTTQGFDLSTAENAEDGRGIGIIKTLNRKLGKRATVITDVGLHQVWTALNAKIYAPERFLTSGGLGAMGFSMGAAIGAHYASGGTVLVITGDGSFNMNFNELTTAVKNHIPLVIAVMNNNALGMIRKLQLERGAKQTFASSLYLNTDYAALAKAMGARGIVIGEKDDIEAKIDEALSGSLPVVIDCKISINEGIKRSRI